jgi:hypothetical protein
MERHAARRRPPPSSRPGPNPSPQGRAPYPEICDPLGGPLSGRIRVGLRSEGDWCLCEESKGRRAVRATPNRASSTPCIRPRPASIQGLSPGTGIYKTPRSPPIGRCAGLSGATKTRGREKARLDLPDSGALRREPPEAVKLAPARPDRDILGPVDRLIPPGRHSSWAGGLTAEPSSSGEEILA